MNLKKTRAVISLIIVAIITISSVCMLSSLTLEFSLASQKFLSSHLISSSIANECNKQLNLKYDALEAESGIPARVFKMAMETYSTAENLITASENIFNEEAAELYSNERIDYFYNLCTEYLDGNDIKYNESDIRRTAEKATLIYSETVGVHNTEAIAQYLTSFRNNCTKATSIAMVSMLMCAILLVALYSKRNFALSYFASGIAGGGLATAVGAIIALIFQIGTKISISPAIYQNRVASMVRMYFAYLMLAGIVLCAIGSVINFLLYKYYKREETRQATRFNKIIAKL